MRKCLAEEWEKIYIEIRKNRRKKTKHKGENARDKWDEIHAK